MIKIDLTLTRHETCQSRLHKYTDAASGSFVRLGERRKRVRETKRAKSGAPTNISSCSGSGIAIRESDGSVAAEPRQVFSCDSKYTPKERDPGRQAKDSFRVCERRAAHPGPLAASDDPQQALIFLVSRKGPAWNEARHVRLEAARCGREATEGRLRLGGTGDHAERSARA